MSFRSLIRNVYLRLKKVPFIGYFLFSSLRLYRNVKSKLYFNNGFNSDSIGTRLEYLTSAFEGLSKSLESVNISEMGVKSKLYFNNGFNSDSIGTRLEYLTSAFEGLSKSLESVNISEMGVKLDHLCTEQIKASEKIALMHDRLEFTRDELFFEMRKLFKISGPSSVASNKTDLAQGKINSPDKLNNDFIAINLGCGHKPIDDMINVDGRDLPGVDVVSDIMSLPFQSDSVDHIYSAHLIEHFPKRFIQDVLLPYWNDLLKPGGKITLVTPDSVSMINDYVNQNMSFEELSLVTFGKQEYDGDFHFVMFSPESIKELFVQAGFVNVSILDANRKNGLCREMELVAFKETKTS